MHLHYSTYCPRQDVFAEQSGTHNLIYSYRPVCDSIN